MLLSNLLLCSFHNSGILNVLILALQQLRTKGFPQKVDLIFFDITPRRRMLARSTNNLEPFENAREHPPAEVPPTVILSWPAAAGLCVLPSSSVTLHGNRL